MENNNLTLDEYEWSLLNYSYESLYKSAVMGKLHPYLAALPLIDLGGRDGLSKRKLKALGVVDYTIVDSQEEGVHCGEYVKSDALTFLSAIENKDTNIMANGFLKSEIVGRTDYAKGILRQVKRILKPHNRVLVTAGFDLDEVAKSVDLNLVQAVSSNVKVWK